MSVVAGTLGALGRDIPWYLTWSPLALLIVWLLWRDDIGRLLGRPGEAQFPAGMLRIAQDADAEAANPRPFGSLPPSVRTYNPEWR